MDSFAHDIEEKELLIRLNNSDETAFTQIYNYYWKKLFFIAAQKLNNFSEAEEVVQDIFLDVWKRREEICITTGLSSYLSVSVKYKVINLLAKRHQQLSYLQHNSSLQSLSDHSTQQHLRFEELKRQLSNETAKLPEKCRLVFQMSREHGFSQKTIAEKLSISEKTVEAHLSKALRTLRMSLGQFMTSLVLAFFQL